MRDIKRESQVQGELARPASRSARRLRTHEEVVEADKLEFIVLVIQETFQYGLEAACNVTYLGESCNIEFAPVGSLVIYDRRLLLKRQQRLGLLVERKAVAVQAAVRHDTSTPEPGFTVDQHSPRALAW